MIQFVNYSVSIDNPMYDRNTLLFAVGFVLRKDTDSATYEPVLQKVANHLVSLEKESEYLFRENTKSSVAHLLESLYIGLLTRQEASYYVDDSNMLNVKLFTKNSQKPISLRDYDVPVLLFQVYLVQEVNVILPFSRHMFVYVFRMYGV